MRLWTLTASSIIYLPHLAFALVPGSTNWFQQSFYFDWNNLTETNPIPQPITAQCDSIKIKWSRGTASGPDPVAPYVIKVYNSRYLNPFVYNAGSGLSYSLPIPFNPGDQYAVCMTDSMGLSGGCQDLYTVYPSGVTSCQNVTVPAKILGVKMTSLETGGPLSRFGWPSSCTDLQFDMVDGLEGGVIGRPPYTLSIAPVFRPPLNMTFQTRAQWTVTLDHGSPFFVSVTDADGLTWSNGPLHAGAGTMRCIAPSQKYPWLTLGSSLGMSFGFLVVGAILATLFTWFFLRKKPTPKKHNGDFASDTKRTPRHDDTMALVGGLTPQSRTDSSDPPPLRHADTSTTAELTYSPTGYRNTNHIEPWIPPARSTTEEAINANAPKMHRYHSGSTSSVPSPMASEARPSSNAPINNQTGRALSLTTSPAQTTPPLNSPEIVPLNPENRQGHEVYVVHHDGGLAPPVTVFTRPGTRITELPPGYDNLIPTPSIGATDDRYLDPRHNDEIENLDRLHRPERRDSNQSLDVKYGASSNASTLPNTFSSEPVRPGMLLSNAEDLPLSAITEISNHDWPTTSRDAAGVSNSARDYTRSMTTRRPSGPRMGQ